MPSDSSIPTLVTGGAGFIGTNVVRSLSADGHPVVVLDNEFLGRLKNLDGVECETVRGSVLDRDVLARLVAEHGVRQVVHLSGYTSAPMYAQDTRRKIIENFEGFVNVLEIARSEDLVVAYASTSSFYARSPKPFREDMLIVPGTPYELGKYIMEQAAHTYNLEFGVRANGLRFFSVYGPHEEHKTRYANNISQFFWSISNGVRPIVFGDGSQTRDFTYVGDLVEAIRMILAKGEGSDVYNIGTGTEHSFNEMIAFINEELGTGVEPVYVDNPLKNYVQETLADTSKIQQRIGWKPRTTLREGIRLLARQGTTFTRQDAEALYAWISTPTTPPR